MTKTTTVASWVQVLGVLRVDSDLPRVRATLPDRALLQEVSQVVANGIDGDEAPAGFRQRPGG